MRGIRFSVLLICVMFLAACEQIDTGHRGIQTRFGEVDMKIGSMSEGLYFYNIFTSSIQEMDVRTLRWEGKTNTYTKDVQQADIKFVITYRLESDKAHLMYKEVGDKWGAVLMPQAVEGGLKVIIGQYDAVDLVSHRGKATEESKAAIQAVLKDKHVIIESFQLVNIQYLKEFEKAVEDKQIAVQRASESVNKTKQIEEEAKQRLISAKAEAESMKIRANALTQNAQLVQYEAVQKWDGKMPNYMLGGGAMPFINIDKK